MLKTLDKWIKTDYNEIKDGVQVGGGLAPLNPEF